MIELFQILTAFNFLLIVAAVVGYRFIGRDAERLLTYIDTTERRLVDSIRMLNAEVHHLRDEIEHLAAAHEAMLPLPVPLPDAIPAPTSSSSSSSKPKRSPRKKKAADTGEGEGKAE